MKRKNHYVIDLEKDNLINIPKVDLIINFHVMEHMKTDFIRIIFKLNKLLNENGVHLLCMPTTKGELYDFNIDPISDLERKKRYGHKYHYLKIGKETLIQKLKEKFVFKPVDRKNYISKYYDRIFNKDDEEFKRISKKKSFFYEIYGDL